MSVETMDDCKAAAHNLLERGAKNVLLTLGSRGAMLVNAQNPDGISVSWLVFWYIEPRTKQHVFNVGTGRHSQGS